MMRPATFIKRLFMGLMISDFNLRRRRRHGHRQQPGVVHYFHQVDDPYSHLAVQKLDELRARYQVEFQSHLVSEPGSDFQGDSERFPGWAVRDARQVASFYNTTLPTDVDQISSENIELANRHLQKFIGSENFANEAIRTGEQLWRGQLLTTESVSEAAGEAVTAAGDKLREELGHYLGGTFYFEGEWYWGCDRLCHLEQRLMDMGYSSKPGDFCVPRPEPLPATDVDVSGIKLEYFPSLRSPYTAISVDRVLDLVKRSGVKLDLKPVMPMMMRGIPAPRFKQLYIISDCKREADYYGDDLGPIVDPFGDPVRRAFSLLPYMINKNRGVTYCREYLKAAWAEGLDITQDKGLRVVVERTGENWDDAIASADNEEWEPLLESNVNEMLTAGLWGVPSFRVTGGNNPEPFVCWGQDRIWRVETEIALRAKT